LWHDFGRDWESLVVGPPGEKQTNIASIFNDTRALARGGVGAVMGSKNLKAIVARGTGRVTVADRARFDRALQLASRAVRMSSAITRMNQEGTANILEFVNMVGALPTRNFQQGQFEGADEISGEAWKEKSWKRNYACFGCDRVQQDHARSRWQSAGRAGIRNDLRRRIKLRHCRSRRHHSHVAAVR
jgi:aldehyde:ferredoxin oxidoreductase